jgi:hypothetical protein
MRGIIVVAIVSLAAPSYADDGIQAAAEPPSKHLVYVELLGKGGLYSVGYEYAIAPWLGFGGAASYSDIRDEQVFTASPYLHFNALQSTHHALFSEVGAILAHSRVPSPVMNWNGVSDTGSGGFLSVGWQYQRRHVVLRTSAAIVAGEGGVAPMVGFAIGARP